MSERYPGGLIRKTAPTVTGPTDGEGGSASGVWKLEDVGYYEEEGGWPKPTLPRELYSWGQNNEGQLGQNNGNTDDLSSPVQVGALTNWASVGPGVEFAAAITTTGELFTWGNNTSYGMLGQGDLVDRSSPVQVGALTNWSQVSGAFEFCAAIKTDGSLWTWGRAEWGRLGNNSTTLNHSSPVQVGSLTDWAFVSNQSSNCIAIKTDGTMWSWGINSNGQLGHNDTAARSSPVQIGALTNWSKVAMWSGGWNAIKTDGTMWACGMGQFYGAHGNNDKINYSSPIQIGSLTNWSKIAAGAKVCSSVKTDGSLWSWGQGDDGQLGQNSTTRISSPVQVGSLTTWLESNCGYYHQHAIKTDGTLWAWGQNNDGQLGNNAVVNVSSPIQIGSDTNWHKIGNGKRFLRFALGITKGS